MSAVVLAGVTQKEAADMDASVPDQAIMVEKKVEGRAGAGAGVTPGGYGPGGMPAGMTM